MYCIFINMEWKRLTSDSRAIKSELFQVESFVLVMDQHYIIEHMRENLISPSDLHTCLLLSTRIRSFVFINSFPVYRPRWSVTSNEILFEIPFVSFLNPFSGSLKTREMILRKDYDF